MSLGFDSPLHAVHLPVYRDNAYQPQLMTALGRAGVRVTDGGGGGTFLRTALTQWQPDVIHFHWLHPYILRETVAGSVRRGAQFLAEVATLKAAGVRVVWTLHNLQNHERRHMGIERWFTTQFVGMCDRVIAHCPAAVLAGRAAFRDPKPGRWIVIPHGSYIGTYPDSITRADARLRLRIDSGDTVFLFFGRIQPYKGILDLVSVFRSIALPKARLIVAGKPADADADRVVRDAVRGCAAIDYRPGYVPDDEVQVLMTAADVVALPFGNILTSSSVLLAMSFGKAVVAPALGCIPETVAEGAGLLYNPTDPAGLTGTLKQAFARRSELAAVGEANRLRAKKWRWYDVAGQTLRVYQSVVTSGRSKP